MAPPGLPRLPWALQAALLPRHPQVGAQGLSFCTAGPPHLSCGPPMQGLSWRLFPQVHSHFCLRCAASRWRQLPLCKVSQEKIPVLDSSALWGHWRKAMLGSRSQRQRSTSQSSTGDSLQGSVRGLAQAGGSLDSRLRRWVCIEQAGCATRSLEWWHACDRWSFQEVRSWVLH